MLDEDFQVLLADVRPRLHRYCARMTGSRFDGEDIVQDALVRCIDARAAGQEIDNYEGWLFRVAHNACLDLLRRSRRIAAEPLSEDEVASQLPSPDAATLGFGTFLRLPPLQRCAVILKDVLGYSIAEIADVAGQTPAACKSALQRGRVALRALAGDVASAPPAVTAGDRQRLRTFVALYRDGDFDTLRSMLAEDVRLDLVGRLALAGRERITPYFTRYAAAEHWRFEAGAIDGRPVMLVFDARTEASAPSHFVDVACDGAITRIRDTLFAPYLMEGADWARFD